MSEMISFQDSMNDSLGDNIVSMDDERIFPYFFDNIQDDNE